MVRIEGIKLPIDHDKDALKKKILSILRINRLPADDCLIIKKKSLDARKKPELFYVYTVDLDVSSAVETEISRRKHDKKVSFVKTEKYTIPNPGDSLLNNRPVIVGSGPAGLFCAYLLAQRGLKPIVYERGESIDERTKTVDDFFKGEAPLNTESNVQFGEGGAGTFSDGKLNTMVKDKSGRNDYVLETFVKFGAKEEIKYMAKPHLGTDELRRIVKNMRNEIIRLGGDFEFGTKLVDIILENGVLKSIKLEKSCNTFIRNADICVLAIGHSARDTFYMLKDRNLEMQQKNFAVGLRIEHLQSMINKSQYGAEYVEGLGAADYKLTHKLQNDRGVYTFCMCPGGYVVNASSEENRVAVNGMSYSGRDSSNANSAVIVTVGRDDFESDDVLAGIEFVRKLEETAYVIGKGKIPIQLFGDYENNRVSKTLGKVVPSTKGLTEFANLRDVFPKEINSAIIEGIHAFANSIEGFDDPDSILSGVESRTSSPVRIVRNECFNSNISGIYPCGEGAGYAGGITSAAMDGMKVAEKIINIYAPYEV